jgi:hypothetical protein
MIELSVGAPKGGAKAMKQKNGEHPFLQEDHRKVDTEP